MSAPPGRDRTTGADMRPKRRGSNARGSGAVRVAITTPRLNKAGGDGNRRGNGEHAPPRAWEHRNPMSGAGSIEVQTEGVTQQRELPASRIDVVFAEERHRARGRQLHVDRDCLAGWHILVDPEVCDAEVVQRGSRVRDHDGERAARCVGQAGRLEVGFRLPELRRGDGARDQAFRRTDERRVPGNQKVRQRAVPADEGEPVGSGLPPIWAARMGDRAAG